MKEQEGKLARRKIRFKRKNLDMNQQDKKIRKLIGHSKK